RDVDGDAIRPNGGAGRVVERLLGAPVAVGAELRGPLVAGDAGDPGNGGDGAVGAHLPHAMVALVGDVDRAVGCNGNVDRQDQRALRGWKVVDARRSHRAVSGDDLLELAGGAHLAYDAAVGLGDV